MTDQEFQQLKFEVDNLKARFEQQRGADPNALHPHGNRRAQGGDTDQQTQQENLNRIFSELAQLRKELAIEVAWHNSLRGDRGVTVNGNVISGSENTNQPNGGAAANLARVTFIINDNGVAEYWSVVATYIGTV